MKPAGIHVSYTSPANICEPENSTPHRGSIAQNPADSSLKLATADLRATAVATPSIHRTRSPKFSMNRPTLTTCASLALRSPDHQRRYCWLAILPSGCLAAHSGHHRLSPPRRRFSLALQSKIKPAKRTGRCLTGFRMSNLGRSSSPAWHPGAMLVVPVAIPSRITWDIVSQPCVAGERKPSGVHA